MCIRDREKIKKIEEFQGISIEEHEENQVSIREMFNQMLKFSEKDRLDSLGLFEFDDVAIEKKVLEFREKKYGSSEHNHYSKGEFIQLHDKTICKINYTQLFF